MKILYKQSDHTAKTLTEFGISDCYYKQLLAEQDRNSITKQHHHTGFELHIITSGKQTYEVNGIEYSLSDGSFLFIPPKIKHRVIHSVKNTEKTAITFRLNPDPNIKCIASKMTLEQIDSLSFITREAEVRKALSPVLMENRIFEILVSVLRQAGLQENAIETVSSEHTALSLAKQYISDNIENAPTVTDVSQYCYLSTKQLVRIFQEYEKISPGDYITRERIKHIESLITANNLTFKQISEQMHFSSEYYFNTFFRKNAGMPPGEFRKMHEK